MEAVVITKPGRPEVLQVQNYATPVPGEEDALIEIKAVGLNRADIFQCKGNCPAPRDVPADIPGLEVAGVVTECGLNVTMRKPADKVCALLTPEAQAIHGIFILFLRRLTIMNLIYRGLHWLSPIPLTMQ